MLVFLISLILTFESNNFNMTLYKVLVHRDILLYGKIFKIGIVISVIP